MVSEQKSSNSETDVKVSIWCLAYNHEKYIARTLQGFVSQITDFRFEILIHEDASTDNTRSIIQEYVDLYPDLFVPVYETENQYSKARGRIAQIMGPKVRGKYVAYCEGDDYWVDEHKLQKQYDIMEKNPDCSICVHRIKNVWEDGTVLDESDPRLIRIKPKKPFKLEPGIIESEQIAKAIWIHGIFPFQTSSHFVRKSVIEDVFYGRAEFAKFFNGDMARLRLSMMHGKYYFLGDVMSHRRIGVPGSWNTRMKATNIQTRIKFLEDQITADQKFDEYSNYQFHEYIQPYLRVLGLNLATESCLYDIGTSKKYKKYLKENPITIKMIHDRDTFWLYIRYLIMRISPRLYKLLYEVQTKLIKGIQR